MSKKILLPLMLLALLLPSYAGAALPDPADMLVKASGPAVYYYASDGKRYVFPNENVYFSWFFNFDNITIITDVELASIPIGGNVTNRPGIKMVKLQTDPKTYAVAPGGVLRWVTTEAIAESMYGREWNQHVDDVSDALFVNYTVGDPIEAAGSYVPETAAANAETINADKGLVVGPNPRRANTAAPRTVQQPNVQAGDAKEASQEALNTTYRQHALNHMNQLRAENGKEPLVLNDLLSEIALAHSRDMAENLGAMSHDGSLGETASERIKQGKVPDFANPGQFTTLPYPDGIGWSGENVGMRDTHYFDSIEAAIEDQHLWFMDEPDDEYNHRTTMLSTLAPFSTVGIGLYLDDIGRLWITEDFVSIQ